MLEPVIAFDDNIFVGLPIVDLLEFSSKSDFFILTAELSSFVVWLDYRQKETIQTNV